MKQTLTEFLANPDFLATQKVPVQVETDGFQVYEAGAFDPKEEESLESRFGRQLGFWIAEDFLDRAGDVMDAIFSAFESRLYTHSSSEQMGNFLAEIMPGLMREGLLNLPGAERTTWDILPHEATQILLGTSTQDVTRRSWLAAVNEHRTVYALRNKLTYDAQKNSKVSTELFIQNFCLLMMSIGRWLDPADVSVVCMSTLPASHDSVPVAQLRSMRILSRVSGFSLRLMHANRAPLVVSNLMAYVSTLQRLAPTDSSDGQIVMVYLDLQLQIIATFCRALGRDAAMTPQPEDVHGITRNTIYSALVATLAPFSTVLRMVQVDDKVNDSSSSSSSSSPEAADEKTVASSYDGIKEHHLDPEVKRFRENPLAGIEESLRFSNPGLTTDMEDVPSIDRVSFVSAFEYCLDLFCTTQPKANLLELSQSLNLVVDMNDTVSVLEPTPLEIAQAIAVCMCYWRYRNPKSCSPICHVTSPSVIFSSLMRTSFLCLKHALVHHGEQRPSHIDRDDEKYGLICCGLTCSRYITQYIQSIDSKFVETIHGLNIPLGPWVALQIAAAAAGQLLMGLRNVTLKLVYARTIALVEMFPRDVGGKICEAALEYTLNELNEEWREIPAALWVREIRALYPLYASAAPLTILHKFVGQLMEVPDVLLPWASAIQEVALTLKLWSIPSPPSIVDELIDKLDKLRGSLRREMSFQPHQSLELADFAIEELLNSRVVRTTNNTTATTAVDMTE